ncbi:MAG: nitronate monooxygenase [Chloroflexota bacterium]
MFKTRVTELLGIKYPILCGPMGYLSNAELVSAVSNAGCLGILVSMTCPTPDDLRKEIRRTRTMTKNPFAVNVTLLPTIRPVKYEDYFAAAIEEGVKIIETSGRSPEPYVKIIKDGKAILMHRVTRTRDARTAERVGADIVSILGTEAGGHCGEEDLSTIVRIPLAVNAVKVPVIAAGGVVDAKGFVAALALGAEGVLMGTRFMTSKECPAHQKVKEWLIQLQETDTILIQRSIRNTVRAAKSEFSQKIFDMEQKGAKLEELLPLISGARGQQAYATGDVSNASITVGQAIGLVRNILSVKEIIDGMVSEAEQIMGRLQKIGLNGG